MVEHCAVQQHQHLVGIAAAHEQARPVVHLRHPFDVLQGAQHVGPRTGDPHDVERRQPFRGRRRGRRPEGHHADRLGHRGQVEHDAQVVRAGVQVDLVLGRAEPGEERHHHLSAAERGEQLEPAVRTGHRTAGVTPQPDPHARQRRGRGVQHHPAHGRLPAAGVRSTAGGVRSRYRRRRHAGLQRDGGERPPDPGGADGHGTASR